jgi:hypothetical protein
MPDADDAADRKPSRARPGQQLPPAQATGGRALARRDGGQADHAARPHQDASPTSQEAEMIRNALTARPSSRLARTHPHPPSRPSPSAAPSPNGPGSSAIPPATVREHVAILRNTGLIITRRHRNTARHT